MTDIPAISAEPRERVRKGGARQTRRDGRVPGVVYGNDLPPETISVPFEPLSRSVATLGFMSHPLDLDLNGKMVRVLPRAVQRHPVTDHPIHIDFLRISGTGMITVNVNVVCDNAEKSPGIKRGGVLNQIHSTVEVTCPAMAVPDALRVDLTGLNLGDVVRLSALKLPPGAKLTAQDLEMPVVSIAAPLTGEKEEAEPEDVEAPE